MNTDENRIGSPTKVQDYIQRFFPEGSNDDWAELKTLAGLTALRVDADGDFYHSNFWRGPMLYSLVRSVEPKMILELGTGRGYGAFCMAKAMLDNGGNGKLITVDRTPGDTKFDWAYVDPEHGNNIIETSVNGFWSEYLPEELRARIDMRCGDSADVHNLLADQTLGADLVFIDGDHSYNGVTLDFLSSYAVSSPNAVFVFDDYSAASGYGIRRLIEEDISQYYEVQIVDMEPTAAHDISVDHKMAVCNDQAATVEARFPSPSEFRFRYLKLRRWIRARLITVAKLVLRR